MKKKKFRDFITLQRGFDLPLRDRRPGKYPVVASTSIVDWHDSYKVSTDGVTTGRSGSLGEVLYIKGPHWPHNTALWVKDFKGNDKRYVCYFLKSLHLEKYNSGAGVPTLNRNHLNQLDILVHDLYSQQKISSFLGSIDDLIKNNLRRIEILEEMAQLIYREWFVHFRYPGHESVPLVDSPLGKIPKGWEVRSIDDLCSLVSRGVTPKYEIGSKRFIINQKANRGAHLEISNLKELTKELFVPIEKIARFGDVLINCLGEGTLGRVHYYTEQHSEWAVDQHMSICRSDNSAFSYYIYRALASEEGQSRIQSKKTGGTNMTMFNISALRSFEIIVPPVKLLREVYLSIGSIPSFCQLLIEKNRILIQLRNLLLPRLISGEIDVSELDIEIPEELS